MKKTEIIAQVLLMLICLFFGAAAWTESFAPPKQLKIEKTVPTQFAGSAAKLDCRNLSGKIINLSQISKLLVQGKDTNYFSSRKDTFTQVGRLNVFVATFIEEFPEISQETDSRVLRKLRTNGSIVFPLDITEARAFRTGFLSTDWCRGILREQNENDIVAHHDHDNNHEHEVSQKSRVKEN